MKPARLQFTVLDDPDICLHSPMLVKPWPVSPVIPVATDRKATSGRFLVQDQAMAVNPAALPFPQRSPIR